MLKRASPSFVLYMYLPSEIQFEYVTCIIDQSKLTLQLPRETVTYFRITCDHVLLLETAAHLYASQHPANNIFAFFPIYKLGGITKHFIFFLPYPEQWVFWDTNQKCLGFKLFLGALTTSQPCLDRAVALQEVSLATMPTRPTRQPEWLELRVLSVQLTHQEAFLVPTLANQLQAVVCWL